MSKGDRPAIISNMSTPSAHQSTLNPGTHTQTHTHTYRTLQLWRFETPKHHKWPTTAGGEKKKKRKRKKSSTIIFIAIREEELLIATYKTSKYTSMSGLL